MSVSALFRTARRWRPSSGGAAAFRGRLAVDGPYFVDGAGALVYPLGLTGFLLRKRFLTGRAQEALDYLAFAATIAAAAGDGVVPLIREFSEVDWDGPGVGNKKGVEQGFFARDFANYDDVSHRMYDAAQQAGVYLQTVGLTYKVGLDQALAHLHRIDDIAAEHENAWLQLANEPSNNDIPIEAIVPRFQPRTRPADTGRLAPSPHPGYDYVGDHPGRDPEFCRKFKGGVEVQDGSGPINKFQPPWTKAFYQDEPARLEQIGTADEWQACFAGNKFFCAGGVIHGGEWAQACRLDLLTADLTQKIAAVAAGVAAVPTQRYAGYRHVDDRGSLRRYTRRGADGQTYEISVRPFGFTIV